MGIDHYHPSHGEDQTNTDAVRSCYAVPHLMMVYGTEASRIATFDRWLNAKLAEAWDAGFMAPRYRSNLNGDYLGKTKNPYRPEATS